MTPDLTRRISRLLWIKLVKLRNPYLITMDGGWSLDDRNELDKVPNAVLDWYTNHTALVRELFSVVFNNAECSDTLWERTLDFIGQ